MLSGATAAISEPLSVGLGWLALINFVVAVFNLIPGFPLDGGRVFRALVWMFTGNARTGMMAAVMGGRLVAYGLFGLGLWSMLALGNLIGGLWIMVIAWFLLNSAEASGRHFDLSSRLHGIRAMDVTEPDVPLVARNTPVDQWIEQDVLRSGNRTGFVGERDQFLGLVTLSDARRIPRERWPHTPVEDIMTPVDKLVAVQPDTPITELLQLMSEKNFNQVPVMERSRLVGWIDRQRMLRTINIHLELKA
jgi:CBS domain-containing protein